MKAICNFSQDEFEIREDDKAFYQRAGVPLPTLSPNERYRRRHGFINDLVYYKRQCDLSGKTFISIFPPKSEYIVACQEAWFDESRDDKSSGRDFDFSRPFFEQFNELMKAAPQLGMVGMNSENCDYCQSVANCKNCYLIAESSNCEDCSYCYWIQKSKDCFDSAYLHDCERCYECVDCHNCSRLQYSQDCYNCHDSRFLDNCSQCSNCLFCSNLRHKEYCIFNKQLSKEEYEKYLQSCDFSSFTWLQKARQEFVEFLSGQPTRNLQIENVEDCSGNYIRNSRNCHGVFHCYDAEDCSYGEHIWRGAKDCMDSNTAGRSAELLYETTNSGINSYNVKFSRYCWGCRDTEYSNQCKNSSYLFGCVSLKPGNKYCILNKQYSEQEYHSLRSKIVEHMKETKEWGEFFPLSISLFGYNNTVSFEHYPITREQALEFGWKWEDQESGIYGTETIAKGNIPDSSEHLAESICKEVLTCEMTEQNFRISTQELAFYKEEQIPLPKLCPRLRTRLLLQKRAGRKLRFTNCANSGEQIPTYHPEDINREILSYEEYLKILS